MITTGWRLFLFGADPDFIRKWGEDFMPREANRLRSLELEGKRVAEYAIEWKLEQHRKIAELSDEELKMVLYSIACCLPWRGPVMSANERWINRDSFYGLYAFLRREDAEREAVRLSEINDQYASLIGVEKNRKVIMGRVSWYGKTCYHRLGVRTSNMVIRDIYCPLSLIGSEAESNWSKTYQCEVYPWLT